MGKLLACGVIVNERDQLLLQRRDEQLQLPGKLVDIGETPEEAITEGLGRTFGAEVWVGDIVCETEFQQDSETYRAALLTAWFMDENHPHVEGSAVNDFGFFALHSLESLRHEGRLSAGVMRLMEVIDREDLTLRDLTP